MLCGVGLPPGATGTDADESMGMKPPYGSNSVASPSGSPMSKAFSVMATSV